MYGQNVSEVQLFVQVSDIFVLCLKSRQFCLDFRHILCITTEHTKVWISDVRISDIYSIYSKRPKTGRPVFGVFENRLVPKRFGYRTTSDNRTI